ncbi:MAG TPA: VIT1/CCC1 transporter family protein [Candidatus Polarisedimenticolaceae bacterium]|nr:VIT1/CCC1 transporter family protein [Candidatus Polarisedimenticolaceae bacterium]
MSATRRPILDPTERFGEILFGLIMVLTFTGTLSVHEAGRADVREMLVAALGCNLAWGIVDGVMYLINQMTVRARGRVLVRKLRGVTDAATAHGMIADTLPERVAEVLGPEELESIRRKLAAREPAAGIPFELRDLKAAGAIAVLVFLTTFPVAIPFMVIHEPHLALRVSNVVALAMLFLLGWSLARYSGGRPWRLGFAMLVLGAVLVAITIALGG